MAPRIKEISFTAPLSTPMETQALVTENADAPWRVIVFPGTPCRKELFYRFLRLAPEDLEVMVLSRPGFGKGHRTPILDFKEQAKTARDFLGDKPTIVLGVSYGGALALTTALENPDTVQGVVTVAALIVEPFAYARWLADMTGAPGVSRFVPNRLHIVRAEIEGRRAQIGDVLSRTGSLPQPLEVIHGDFDHLVSLSDARRLVAAANSDGTRRANFKLIPTGTHYLELQFPKQLYAAIERVRARGA